MCRRPRRRHHEARLEGTRATHRFIVLADATSPAPQGAASPSSSTPARHASPPTASTCTLQDRRVLDVLTGRVAALKAGSGLTPGVSIGPLIDDHAMAKMERQVADARSKGATVLAGGRRLTGDGLSRGRFYAPPSSAT